MGSTIFVNALAVTGIVILTGYAGQISLGHAGFAGIGGYACALAPVHLGLPSALSVVLGAAVSGALAWLVGRPILRLKGYYLGVASLGFGILVAMVLNNERQLTKGPDGIAVPDPGLRSLIKGWGLDLSNGQFWYAMTGIALVIGAWLALNLYHSPTGRRYARCTVRRSPPAPSASTWRAPSSRRLSYRPCTPRSRARCWRCRTASSRRTSRASCTRSKW